MFSVGGRYFDKFLLRLSLSPRRASRRPSPSPRPDNTNTTRPTSTGSRTSRRMAASISSGSISRRRRARSPPANRGRARRRPGSRATPKNRPQNRRRSTPPAPRPGWCRGTRRSPSGARGGRQPREERQGRLRAERQGSFFPSDRRTRRTLGTRKFMGPRRNPDPSRRLRSRGRESCRPTSCRTSSTLSRTWRGI